MAVLPFVNLRDPAQASGLAAYLQSAVAQAVLRTGRASLLDAFATAQWQAHLGLDSLGDVTPSQLRQMGVDAVVQGGVQQVLDQVALRLRVQGAQGDLLRPSPTQLDFSLASQSPQQVVDRMGNVLVAALLAGGAYVATPQPAQWPQVEEAYRLAARMPAVKDAQARPALLQRLQAYQSEPGLAAAIQRCKAELLLEQALLFEHDPQRQQSLQSAQVALQAALTAEPWNADPRALLGEVWYYLRQDYL
ncbi:MAG TPA: hypothetical protein VL359_05200, partial [bacterium]|nr:hypothetical protein [bacterium]